MDFEVKLRISTDDPRFRDMVAYLQAIKQRGRYSPVPRIIEEWALLGFLMQTGKLAVGGTMPAVQLDLPTDIPDPADIAAGNAAVASLFDEF